nr:hypothetical protein CFP56_21815 [Quercus suber]
MSGQAAVQFQAPARADRTVPAPLTEANLNAHAAQLAAANSSASRTGGDGDARVADHDAVAHATAAAQTARDLCEVHTGATPMPIYAVDQASRVACVPLRVDRAQCASADRLNLRPASTLDGPHLRLSESGGTGQCTAQKERAGDVVAWVRQLALVGPFSAMHSLASVNTVSSIPLGLIRS